MGLESLLKSSSFQAVMPSTMNLSQLSRYLHLPEQQVKKLVDRGEIPSRRIGGEAVFSREEVHHWLEQRIGVSDGEELAHVESALDRSIPVGAVEAAISIAALIPDGAIALPLHAKTRDSVIRSMVTLGENCGLLWDAHAMIEAIKAREELHSTALENGVALLHPRRPMPSILGDTFIALGMIPGGVPFGGGYDNYTDIFFLICSTDDRVHLRILTRLSRLLAQPEFIDQLREQESEQGVRELIVKMEGKL